MARNEVSQPFFQVGVLVADIDAARAELTAALGLDWGEIVEREIDGWAIRICFATQGPPFLELIEGPPGSPWDADGGSRIDHIGYWTESLEEAKQTLHDAGVELEFDGSRQGGVFTYHRGRASGLRVELVDAGGRAAFYQRWGLGQPDQPGAGD